MEVVTRGGKRAATGRSVALARWACVALFSSALPACSKCASRSGASGEARPTSEPATRPAAPHPRVVHLAAGPDHTCALIADSTVRCWGRGAGGAIGDGKEDADDGTPHNVMRPFPVVGPPALVQVAGRMLGTAAVAKDGSVWSWGHWFYWLGDGTAPGFTPGKLPTLRAFSARVKEIAFGASHACVLFADGHVECWGRGVEGQLGDGSQRSSHSPLRVEGLTQATRVFAGGEHSCAITSDGSLRCWGLDPKARPELPPDPEAVRRWDERHGPSRPQLAVGDPFGDLPPSPRAAPPRGAAPSRPAPPAVAAPPAAAPPPHPDTTPRFPGPRPAFDATPRTIEGITGPAQVVIASRAGGDEATCVREQTGRVQCWGFNGLGELGDGTTVDRAVPKPVSGLGEVVHLAAAPVRVCAVERSGRVLCWGSPFDPNDPRPAPRVVEGLTDATEIALGDRHACALRRDGDVWCWGVGEAFQLGRAVEADFTPAPVEW